MPTTDPVRVRSRRDADPVPDSAGPHVDLTEFRDDHAPLEPALDRLRAAVELAELAELRDTLTEHIGNEGDAVLP
ncbi:hypothetical protein SAMN06893096_10850 [Geodermatophilus pulveris]|uniref:Uncharacterized protein n=1 Tax=Geodermatophilus pulveris TaxID=1564159 RepID=A0A239HDB7_9ACTN|nr:hypothetical protein [Geodermatophilus pulveris]SNS79399.1 hypothetical protein SAMN06893096_10850 [Geodermatophilus pulveris]